MVVHGIGRVDHLHWDPVLDNYNDANLRAVTMTTKMEKLISSMSSSSKLRPKNLNLQVATEAVGMINFNAKRVSASLNKHIRAASHQICKSLLRYASIINNGPISRTEHKMARSECDLVDIPEDLGGILALHLRKSRRARIESGIETNPPFVTAMGLGKI